MHKKASELYNELLEKYFDQYEDLSDAKRKKMDAKYNFANSFLDTYHGYSYWGKMVDATPKGYEKEESVDTTPKCDE